MHWMCPPPPSSGKASFSARHERKQLPQDSMRGRHIVCGRAYVLTNPPARIEAWVSRERVHLRQVQDSEAARERARERASTSSRDQRCCLGWGAYKEGRGRHLVYRERGGETFLENTHTWSVRPAGIALDESQALGRRIFLGPPPVRGERGTVLGWCRPAAGLHLCSIVFCIWSLAQGRKEKGASGLETKGKQLVLLALPDIEEGDEQPTYLYTRLQASSPGRSDPLPPFSPRAKSGGPGEEC